ncbi:MAG TPA: hypothetical protein PKW94_01625 [Candidatus Dojkabacteria bacterium]|jgi:hypothetical protein|nr:hypothetical protein [Candidatus Dojkabacteria bacterium]HOR05757.1 hypothetical protein [Candidatus Dojkabacteria bacterium]HOT60983.1 hypothetical protein [Candidatus Dojkabacteria bacterium]HQI92455.1 hypothetical protein [Candidatus Dojkabacteria bacterium]
MNAPNSGLNFLPKEEEQVKKGFSVLDFLVILCALFVIAFLGYLIINPQKEGAENRNVVRNADVSLILSAVASYTKKTGEIPDVIPIGEECVKLGNEICKMGPYDCVGMVDLSVLNSKDEGEEIVASIPSDPTNKSTNGTGYYITQDGSGTVTVCAPYAERGELISFEKYLY